MVVSPRKTRAQSAKKPARREENLSDLDDDVDKFHKSKDQLPVNLSSEDESEDSEDEEAVYNLSSGDEEESDDFDSEEEAERDTYFGKLAKQAKVLEAKLKIAQGEEEDEEDSEEDEDDDDKAKKAGWGASRRSYYDADVADIEASEDEEDLQEEEKEARRLQREAAADLRPEDYEATSSSSDDDDGEEEEEEEETLGAAATKTAGNKKKATKSQRASAAAVETLTRDPLSQEALQEAVERDALELEALVSQLRSSLNEVRNRLAPILAEVREGGLATEEGVSYLEAKHMLLLSYVGAIVFYLLLKAEGKPVAGHPVVTRLVELRAYLEKIRPIDKRLHYQVEKLLAAATMAQGQGADGEEDGGEEGEDGGGMAAFDEQQLHGPNPEALLAGGGFAELLRKAMGGGGGDSDQDIPTNITNGGGGGDVYRPPRLNPISMETEEGYAGKDKRKMDALQRRAARSDFVQQLGRELAGAPEEQKYNAYVTGGMDTAAALRERQRLAAREEVEEELMIRVPLSKEERKRLKAQKRAGLSGKALLDDFADDVADIVAAAEATKSRKDGKVASAGGGAAALTDPMLSRYRTSQAFGADLYAQQVKKALRSGDDDLPVKEPLHERRAKMDGVRAKKAGAQLLHHNNNDDGNDVDGMPMEADFGGSAGGDNRKRRGGGEEDEFYRKIAEAAATKKAKKKDMYSYPETLAPTGDAQEFGARGITTEIEKNRGLTPHRRKDMKNPRKKHRVKYAQAQVRRKGAVQEVRASEGGAAYGGETTGIKSRVTKSVKF